MVRSMTSGNPIRLILAFTVPLLIGNVFQQFYNIADIIIVGRTIGVNALAAVGAVAPVFMAVFGLTIGLSSGFSVITGQRFGAEDMDGVRRSVTTSAMLALAWTLLLTLGVSLAMPLIMRLMNISDVLYDDAYHYMLIVVLGLVAMMSYNLLSCICRALGDSRTPLYFLIVSSLLNIALALLFIVVFGWGVPGSAIALVIAQAVSAILCLCFMRRRFPMLRLTRADWAFDWPFAWQHLRLGLPMAVQFLIISMGILVLQSVCNTFGPETIAGFVSATEDNVSPTVIGLLPRQYQGAGLFPVGRLAKDTTGPLLITNDGTWAHGITSPKKHMDKIYDAVVEGDIPLDMGQRFADGIVLDDGLHCLPAKAVQTGPQSLTVVVQEGKFHQVKRMCAAVGLKVVQLHRRSVGSVVLDEGLEPGQFRPLTDEEREALKGRGR